MTSTTIRWFQSMSALAVGCSFMLTAQHTSALPRTHDGFYLQIDAGLGYLSSTAESGGAKVKYSGMTLPTSLMLGGTVGPVVLGGGFITDYVASSSMAINGSSSNVSGLSLYLYSVGFFADIYPDPHGGLHFQPYIGYGGLQASYQGYTGNSATGMVLAMGGGYDWWVADEWSIGVMGRVSYAPLSLDGVGFSTISPAVLASFTYH